jgi:hypothetical protein
MSSFNSSTASTEPTSDGGISNSTSNSTSTPKNLDEFLQPRKSLRFLVISDVDIPSAHLLAEKFVPDMPQFDCILCLGPFDPTNEASPVSHHHHHNITPHHGSKSAGASTHSSSSSSSSTTKENAAIVLSEMSSILASLENIVCRVVYLTTEEDSPSALMEQLHLTPNSVNIYARRMTLMSGLFVSGYTEISDNLMSSDSDHDHAEDAGSFSSVGSRTFGAAELDIDDILEVGSEKMKAAVDLMVEHSSEARAGILNSNRGVFMLNYAHAHTLNQFIFHKRELLKKSGVTMCIVPRKCGIQCIPSKIDELHIIVPPSLKKERKYVVVDLKCDSNSVWQLESSTVQDI